MMESQTEEAPMVVEEAPSSLPTPSVSTVSEGVDDVDDVTSGRGKRVRKTKIRLDEEENYLNETLGLNKKKRPRRVGPKLGQFQNANANASLKRFKPKKVDENKRMSANMAALKVYEELSDSSLKQYLSVMRYFLSPKVSERLESAPDSFVTKAVRKVVESKAPTEVSEEISPQNNTSISDVEMISSTADDIKVVTACSQEKKPVDTANGVTIVKEETTTEFTSASSEKMEVVADISEEVKHNDTNNSTAMELQDESLANGINNEDAHRDINSVKNYDICVEASIICEKGCDMDNVPEVNTDDNKHYYNNGLSDVVMNGNVTANQNHVPQKTNGSSEIHVENETFDMLNDKAPAPVNEDAVSNNFNVGQLGLQGGGSREIVTDVITKQPRLLVNVKMRPYQIEGLQWLIEHYQRGINCILADEMGLGKTLQTISYFAYLKERNIPRAGPHLVVVPLSVLFNWVAELKKFCPSLRILRLHTNNSAESQRLREVINAADTYDVLVTTYEMVKGSMEITMRRILWTSMVLDEGHRIKNSETITSKACRLFKARHKIILTGTPVQNDLHETFCLLNFLHPNIFDQSEKFDDCFSFNKDGQMSVNRQVLDMAHYLLRPFVLRRVKTEVEQLLPPKVETLIECPMSAMQRFWSKRLLLKNSDVLLEFEKSMNINSDENEDDRRKVNSSDSGSGGDVNDSKDSGAWKKLQSLLAQLRKAANHPFLFPDAESISDDPNAAHTNEDIVTASGKMVILDQLLKKLKRKGHRVVLFSQYTKTLDIISDYLEYRKYSFSRLDGQTNRVYREVLINQFNRKKSSKFIFCLSTRAGGEGVNLYSADTVILFDSDWNPQVDIQAMARVHRIGQTKTVHVYRLVTTGTVEERIVQRAQKKLFLDSVVNRGSTSKALELDELREDLKQEDGEGEDTNDIGLGAMMSALKFGWNSCFSVDEKEDAVIGENVDIKLSDEILNSIIDRKRGLGDNRENSGSYSTRSGSVKQGASSTVSVIMKSAEGADKVVKKKRKTIDASIRENQQVSADLFVENAPMVGLRQLGNEVIGGSSPPSNKMKDIAAAWASKVSGKRESKSRLDSVVVKGVGKVSVLKSNQYTLEGGEPSVFESEAKGKKNTWARDSKNKKQSFINQDHCQVCFDYGDLLLCQHCPASYHLKCCHLRKVPSGQWSCPHHQGCVTCLRSCGAIGFTFRCEACANSYCEDCLPSDVEFLEYVERWSELGFRYPRNCCYIRCSKGCNQYMLSREKEARALKVAMKKEAKSAKATKTANPAVDQS